MVHGDQCMMVGHGVVTLILAPSLTIVATVGNAC